MHIIVVKGDELERQLKLIDLLGHEVQAVCEEDKLPEYVMVFGAEASTIFFQYKMDVWQLQKYSSLTNKRCIQFSNDNSVIDTEFMNYKFPSSKRELYKFVVDLQKQYSAKTQQNILNNLGIRTKTGKKFTVKNVYKILERHGGDFIDTDKS